MNSQIWTIGRDSRRDIVLRDDTISSLHASLKYENGYFFIKDENSTNGSYIIRSGEKSVLHQYTDVSEEDTIIFGAKSFVLHEIIEKISQKEIEIPDISDKSEGKGKKIRCYTCMKPIQSDTICPSCGSNEHLLGSES